MNEIKIKVGQRVVVTVPWLEDELPSSENFREGIVLQIVERNPNCFYAYVEGMPNLVPLDRITPIKRRRMKNVALRISKKINRFHHKIRRNTYVKKSKPRLQF